MVWTLCLWDTYAYLDFVEDERVPYAVFPDDPFLYFCKFPLHSKVQQPFLKRCLGSTLNLWRQTFICKALSKNILGERIAKPQTHSCQCSVRNLKVSHTALKNAFIGIEDCAALQFFRSVISRGLTFNSEQCAVHPFHIFLVLNKLYSRYRY